MHGANCRLFESCKKDLKRGRCSRDVVKVANVPAARKAIARTIANLESMGDNSTLSHAVQWVSV
jgi:hypothetical protein